MSEGGEISWLAVRLALKAKAGRLGRDVLGVVAALAGHGVLSAQFSLAAALAGIALGASGQASMAAAVVAGFVACAASLAWDTGLDDLADVAVLAMLSGVAQIAPAWALWGRDLWGADPRWVLGGLCALGALAIAPTARRQGLGGESGMAAASRWAFGGSGEEKGGWSEVASDALRAARMAGWAPALAWGLARDVGVALGQLRRPKAVGLGGWRRWWLAKARALSSEGMQMEQWREQEGKALAKAAKKTGKSSPRGRL